MLVVLQAMIDEHDAVMTDPDVKSAKSSSDGQFWRGAREECNLRSELPRYALRARAVVEYRSRWSDDQIEPQHG